MPQPDGSYRSDPPRDQVGPERDQQIREAIWDALIAHGFDKLGFEVDRGRVIVRGWVRDRATARRIQRIVAEAAPDAEIDSHLHVE